MSFRPGAFLRVLRRADGRSACRQCATRLTFTTTAFADHCHDRKSQGGVGAQSQLGPQGSQGQQSFQASHKLIGQSAESSDGQELGKIKDISFHKNGQMFLFVDPARPLCRRSVASGDGDPDKNNNCQVSLNTTKANLQSALK